MALPISAGVNERARRVSVVQTAWCDIIFGMECKSAAHLIASNADDIFEQAAKKLQLRRKFRLCVVISCDSEVPSVTYSPVPYNRIVIYCTSPASSPTGRSDTLLAEFTREAVKAVSQCQRGAIEQVIADMFSDVVQPSYLVNMPQSYFYGLQETIWNEENAYSSGEDAIAQMSDREGAALLARAKSEGKFPTWMQAAGARDIYPDAMLTRAAGSAFAAYIQWKWGMRKYVDLWKEAGKFHLFRLNAGIFKKVYGVTLKSAWSGFEDAVPIIDASDESGAADKEIVLSKQMGEELPRYVVSGEAGTLYYCEARGEVMLLPRKGIAYQQVKDRALAGKKARNTRNKEERAQRLFFATDIIGLTLGSSGELLAVSRIREGTRENLPRFATRVYDLRSKKYIGHDHDMKCAVIMDNDTLLCGVTVDGERSALVAETVNGERVFKSTFKTTQIPRSVFRAGVHKVGVLLTIGGDEIIRIVNIISGEAVSYIVPQNIVITSIQATGENSAVFAYLVRDKVSCSRVGIMHFGTGEAVMSLQQSNADDRSDCALFEHTLFFVRRYAEYSVLVSEPFDDAKMSTVALDAASEETQDNSDDGTTQTGNTIAGYKIMRYNPFRYMMRGTWMPMLPLYSFSLDDGYELSPGLGVTYVTSQDALECAEGVMSFGSAFADPSKDYTEFIDDYSLSVYARFSLLPVDIAAGGTWRWNGSGMYTLQTLLATQWMVPMNETNEHWTFDLRARWTARTQKAGEDGSIVSTAPWASVADAFNTVDFSIGSAYNNYHRSGMSNFEQLGFAVGSKLVFSYEADALRRISFANEPDGVHVVGELGFMAPRLIPVPYYRHMVLSLPLTISSDVNIDLTGGEGAVLHSYAEVLLIGWEAQTGIGGLNLYLARAGLSCGIETQQQYDITLDKSKTLWENMDFFDNSFADIATNERRYDYVYLAFRVVASPIVGMLTRLKVTVGSKLRFALEESSTDAALILKVVM